MDSANMLWPDQHLPVIVGENVEVGCVKASSQACIRFPVRSPVAIRVYIVLRVPSECSGVFRH